MSSMQFYCVTLFLTWSQDLDFQLYILRYKWCTFFKVQAHHNYWGSQQEKKSMLTNNMREHALWRSYKTSSEIKRNFTHICVLGVPLPKTTSIHWATIHRVKTGSLKNVFHRPSLKAMDCNRLTTSDHRFMLTLTVNQRVQDCLLDPSQHPTFLLTFTTLTTFTITS